MKKINLSHRVNGSSVELIIENDTKSEMAIQIYANDKLVDEITIKDNVTIFPLISSSSGLQYIKRKYFIDTQNEGRLFIDNEVEIHIKAKNEIIDSIRLKIE